MLALAAAMLLGTSAGCVRHKSYTSKPRLERGLILILPGIEGESLLNHSIADGLKDSGVPDAIDIYDWTGTRWFMIGNTMRYQRNLRQASLVAHRLREYQRTYPDRPIHLVGHSGGGGLAVMVLEQLPENKPITAAILLAPALSPSYNLAPALRRTEYGIYNFWSPADLAFLGIGTTAFGNMDRGHGPAAGAIGFRVPEGLGAEEVELYRDKLHQVRWRTDMLRGGHLSGHMSWANPLFVRDWLSKIVFAHEAGEKPRL